MPSSLLDEYRKYAETCRSTDYTRPLSIRAHNRAAAKMKELVKRAEREGEQSVRALGTLLDESSTREWLAFQLLDTLENVPPDVEQKCVGIIESISNDPLRNADAVGARQWLEAWKRR